MPNHSESLVLKGVLLLSTLLTSSVYADPVYFYQGNPISPHVFAEFVPWLSDTNSSPTVTIDLAKAANTRNEYSKEMEQKGEHKYCSNHRPLLGFEEDRYTGRVCYQWDGKLKNDLHLFTVTDNGGGTLTTMDQFLIKFHKGEEVDLETGKTTDRDLMTLMGTYGVYGDRSRLRVEDGNLKYMKEKWVHEHSELFL